MQIKRIRQCLHELKLELESGPVRFFRVCVVVRWTCTSHDGSLFNYLAITNQRHVLLFTLFSGEQQMSLEDETSGWQLTESDPGVFTELLKTLGVPLIVDDLYSLDSESLASLRPLRAFIFLFKWLPEANDEAAPQSGGEYDADFVGFFAHQVVNNACATLAVLNALGNIPSLTAGPQLTDLMGFTVGMDPQTRGLVITSSDWLREAHNALSPPHAISLDGLGLPKRTEDAYHFVIYLPVMGALYELDGLKQYPVRHGAFEESEDGWIRKARFAWFNYTNEIINLSLYQRGYRNSHCHIP
ncbi:hypothetical protein AX15_001330 [Amanita polypyramis BW_CC]|nr:hypothetical protein AX15_001330 [Amanita polypyramis BW_CC]